ncbi:unnamed protein product [Cylicocyclus nassatus]|uniref:Uncharacterized protein n=1 Tax=Cylicocyclus nassatus TaxID=53992 RepID=A0AA36HGV5_CYLNA|nr:unnamed protein product [Cylicocyclus nassatus]
MQLLGPLLLLYCFFFFVNTTDARDDDQGYYEFLKDAINKDEEIRRAEKKNYLHHLPGGIVPQSYKLPGDYVPLPGRSTNTDYWPLYPMANQYMAAVTLDTSKARHTGIDLNVPVPWWGFLDMNGHIIERYQDKWAKVGYTNNPINMLGLSKQQLVRLMSDPSLHWNRQQQPNLPIAILPRSYTPQSCKPPFCNPYHSSVGVGVEANVHIEDGIEGELDLPVPISKEIGYRLPIDGNIHYDFDDISVTYGQNARPVDPLVFAPDQPLNRAKRSLRLFLAANQDTDDFHKDINRYL